MKTGIRKFIGTKELYLTMIKVAWPIALQALITVGVNLMDTIMLSSMGDAQLSASTLGGNFFSLLNIMCMGIGMGASVLTARYYGMNKPQSLKKTITIMLRFSTVLGILFTIATALFPTTIMSVYTSDPNTVKYGAIYLLWIVPTFFTGSFTITLTTVLRSVKLVKVPLVSSLISFFANIFFNWIFIFGKLGAPRMEIAGAALGTTIARVIEFIIIAGYFFVIDKRIHYRVKDLFMKCSDLVKEFFKISIPVLISDTLLVLGTNVMSIIMGHIGSTYVAANAVSSIVMQLVNVFSQSISNASGIITGNKLGQGKVDDAMSDGYAFTGMGVILGVFGAAVIMALRDPVINSYNISPEAKEIAQSIMLALAVLVIFQMTNSILTKGVLRAGGDTRFLMIGDILFLWVASIPFGALAGLVWHWPPFWIATMLRIDQVFKCVWCLWRLKSGKWIKVIKPAEDDA
ncbi:MAG: MATE family efflux transporter [Lachnospiraceae bacterium]|nr:MATE family efflux transporter [Lachnospiraceae bacterium]